LDRRAARRTVRVRLVFPARPRCQTDQMGCEKTRDRRRSSTKSDDGSPPA
jgi:hypothetical protein